MTTIAGTGLSVADSWQVSVGGGWIAVMLIAMAFCFAAMFASMWLMGGGRAWSICRLPRPLETARTDLLGGAAAPNPDQDLIRAEGGRSQR